MQTREQGTVMRSTDFGWGLSRDRGTIITGAALIGVAGVAWFGVVLQGTNCQDRGVNRTTGISRSVCTAYLP